MIMNSPTKSDGKSIASPESPDGSSSASTSAASVAAHVPGLSASSSSASIASSAAGAPIVWPNTADHYELLEVIGYGATAVVNAALCKSRNQMCAIKRINLEKWSSNVDELHKEIVAMSSCNHDNIVTYFTSFVVKEELWLVLRLLEYGSFLDIIRYRSKHHDCRHGVFEETTIATVLREVLRGLDYLHSSGHIHRDIKAGNILLGAEGQVQIADFGVSAYLTSGADLNRAASRHTFVGTPCWMAPEVMEQVTGYDYKADIWSFGITAIELVTGAAPYHKYPAMKVLMLTLANDPPTLDTEVDDKEMFKQYSKLLRKMISECLQKDTAKRPTASELLKHPFFKSKAKDKKYILANVVNTIQSLRSRMTCKPQSRPVATSESNRLPGSSGKFHRDGAGQWVWSSDDDDDEVECKKVESKPSPDKNVSSATIDLILRMRNPKRELNDIRFEFQPNKDTPVGIAKELFDTGLIVAEDVERIAASIGLMVGTSGEAKRSVSKAEVFPVVTGVRQGEHVDEKALLGFAQLSLIFE